MSAVLGLNVARGFVGGMSIQDPLLLTGKGEAVGTVQAEEAFAWAIQFAARRRVTGVRCLLIASAFHATGILILFMHALFSTRAVP